jgi:hypothetical protein
MRFLKSKAVWFLLPAILIIGLSAIFAADFWEKDYKQWSDKDCLKMLTDSPWAYSLKLLQSGLGSAGSEGQGYVKYDIQLLSALPIRQSNVRRVMIATKQQEPDKANQDYLAADYSNFVVVNIEYSTNVQNIELDLARAWQNQTLALIQNSCYLIGSKGVKIPLKDVKIGQGAKHNVQLLFERQRDGKPLLTAEDKTLILQFPYPVVGGMGDGRGQVEFKVKKMIYNGNIEF